MNLCVSSCIPMISLCKMASKDVKVAISGDASDEIFGGYNRYKLYNKILTITELVHFILKINLLKNYLIITFFKIIIYQFLPAKY